MNLIKSLKQRFLSPAAKDNSTHKQDVSASQIYEYDAVELDIPLDEISEGAMLVCRTLQNAGFDGYLVGGCVRDWMLDMHPKDFDVATNATPEQIRPLFKRARIIGRRFKLVHVHHKREMIEVATYRAAPGRDSQNHKQSQSGRVLRDNVYGNLADDAQRRDFTVNALYLDPVAEIVMDYQGGVEDIDEHRLRLIGDPDKRFAEDPVRMLRALRFKAKLDFDIPAELDDLINKHKSHFKEVSNARLFDETFKLFHYAHAIDSWETLDEHGFIEILFPLTSREIKQNPDVEDFIFNALENTDRRVGQGKPVIPAYFFAVILWHAYLTERQNAPNLPRGKEGVYRAAEKVFAKQYPTIAIPKRVSGIIIEIWDLQWHLEMRRVKSIDGLLENRRFRAAYDFMLLRESIGEIESEVPQWWTKIQNQDDAGKREMVQALPRPKPQRGRRRRRPNRSRKKN